MAKVPVGTPVTLRLVDFSGGWNSSDSPSLLSTKEAQRADNVSYDMRGTLSPRKGRKKRFSEPISPNRVTGLASLTKKDGTTQLIVATGSELYRDEPHMEHRWDSSGDWKRGTLSGDATADRVDGSLTLSNEPVKTNEKQRVMVTGSPTGGSFKLTFNGQTTANIAYNATADQVKEALIKLSNIGGDNEQQKVTVNGSPTGGTFTLTLNGKTTSPIPFNATADQVRDAIAILEGVGVGNVEATGNAKGPWTITFVKDKGKTDLPQMTATSSLTGGSNPSVSVETLVNGSADDINVTGNAGGPWVVEFIGQYETNDVPLMTATHTLTGGTSPGVIITVDQEAADPTITETWDTTAQFDTGTKDKVASSGDKLTLTRKGTDFTRTFDSQADWNSGTRTNVDTSSSPGDIKLAVERAAVNIVKSSQADFDAMTKVSVSTTIKSGSVTLAQV